MSVKDPRMPQPRFAIVSPYGPPSRVSDDTAAFLWHRNHRLYEYEGQAKNYAADEHKKAIVLRVDPALCEPVGLSPEESFAFAERMAQYWADQMAERHDVIHAAGPARPRPKKDPTPKKKRRRRATAAAPVAPMQSNLGNALATFAAGALVGGIVGQFISPPSPPAPPEPPNTTMKPFAPFSPFSPFSALSTIEPPTPPTPPGGKKP